MSETGRVIALLGGTFDPPHLGHLAVAKISRAALGVAEVWLVPCARQPLKGDLVATKPLDRLSMVRLMVGESGIDWLKVEDSDMARGGTSYTVETLERLREKYPQDRFIWVVGSDTLDNFPRWHRIEELTDLAEVAVVARPGYPQKATCIEYHWVEGLGETISATELREAGSQDPLFRQWVGPAVRDYIKENRLYRPS